MSNENKISNPNQPASTTEQPKQTLRDRFRETLADHPVAGTVALSAATTGGIKAAGWGYQKTKEYFAEKSAEPAKEQAASFVAGVARSFAGRFGR